MGIPDVTLDSLSRQASQQYNAYTRPFANRNMTRYPYSQTQALIHFNQPFSESHVSYSDRFIYPSAEKSARSVAMSRNQRLKPNPPSQGSESAESGIFNERVLVLLFETIRWDIHTLCSASSVNRKLRAIAKRLLWREVCLYRAPRMVATLANGMPNGRFCGGWHALAKLMFFCCGFESTRHFKVSQPSPGHFAKASRFSKTSGRSFLAKKCRGDLLYVSDPCEHPTGDKEDDLGIYRGVFKGFSRSKTRACLIGRQVELEERMRCPYCGARVWSMTTAGLVPKSAARRLGSHSGGLDYFVCVNGHLHGTCWLVPLSSDEDEGEDEKEEEEEGSEGDAGGIRGVDNQDRKANHMGMEFKGRGKMEMGNSLVGPHEVLVGIHQC